MKDLFILSILLVISIAYNGCKKETNCINGNGEVMQEQRVLDPFNKVIVIGAFSTTIDQGQNNTVDFFAESNIIPIIRTDVNNQLLRIIVNDGNCYNTDKDVEVYISSPDYEEITIDGSGDVSANNLNLDGLTLSLKGSGVLNALMEVQQLTLNLTGSGNANLVGNGNQGIYLLSGSGNIYGSNFIQDNASVTVSGSGDIHVNVTGSLNVVISGSGNVYYKGNPANITQNITGSGQLINEG